MRKETKENIQYSTAVGMLVLGASLAVAGFVCSEPMGQIHDSVLWLFAQCLLYAGSVFGISIYINSRFNNLIEQLKEKEGKKIAVLSPFRFTVERPRHDSWEFHST